MRKVDVNCDMGEGMQTDKEIMPYIDSVNIACGEHAGDADTIRATVRLAIHHNVNIGAHPGYADRKNFGRKDMILSQNDLYQLIFRQVQKIKKITEEEGKRLIHVKPHGALYNAAAKDAGIAEIIITALMDIDQNLIMVGLSGSLLILVGKRRGLQTFSEVFGDRSYQDDGSLTPRSESNALLDDSRKVIQQVSQMVIKKSVTTVSGKVIPVDADTICVHGDGKHAVEFVRNIREWMSQGGYGV